MLKRHTYKLTVGVPIAILVASSISLVRSDEAIGLVCKDTRYVAVDEYFAIDVVVTTDRPANAVEATVQYPTNYVSFVEAGISDSIIDLWTSAPALRAPGTVSLSGGMVSPTGYVGTGSATHLTFKAIAPGTAHITLPEAHLLAHDGKGTELLQNRGAITIIVRDKAAPTPDVNLDKRVNLVDVGIVSTRLFGSYEKAYDLNRDGKITLADLSIIFAQYVDGSRLGSLALLF